MIRQLAALLLGAALAPAIARAQSYTVDWYKIAGGGGTSTNGPYQVSGTIGQPDAGVPMFSGPYSVTGGYWSLISVVPSPGVPRLVIQRTGFRSVQVLWPDTGNYTLLQTINLAPASWTTNTATVTTLNGTNSITITPPLGNLFLRLRSP